MESLRSIDAKIHLIATKIIHTTEKMTKFITLIAKEKLVIHVTQIPTAIISIDVEKIR